MTPCYQLLVSDVNYWVHLNAASASSVASEISAISDVMTVFQVLLPILSVEPVFLVTEGQRNEHLVQGFWHREGIEDTLQQI